MRFQHLAHDVVRVCVCSHATTHTAPCRRAVRDLRVWGAWVYKARGTGSDRCVGPPTQPRITRALTGQRHRARVVPAVDMIAHSVLGEVALYALAACSVALASVFLGHYLAVQKYLASRLEPAGVCARAHVRP